MSADIRDLIYEQHENGYAVDVPYLLKDQFKVSFKSAKFLPEYQKWYVGPRSKKKLDLWIDQFLDSIVAALTVNEHEITSYEIQHMAHKHKELDTILGEIRMYEDHPYKKKETKNRIGELPLILESCIIIPLNKAPQRYSQDEAKQYLCEEISKSLGDVILWDEERIKWYMDEIFGAIRPSHNGMWRRINKHNFSALNADDFKDCLEKVVIKQISAFLRKTKIKNHFRNNPSYTDS